MSTTIHSIAVANPTVTLGPDGLATIDWPESEPDMCLMSRDLLAEMTSQINELRILKAGFAAAVFSPTTSYYDRPTTINDEPEANPS